MRPLSFAVAALALVALVVGQQSSSAGTIGMGVVGVLLALATFRAQTIATFLRIFSVIFAVEYVLTGSAALLGQAGYWPAGLRALIPPPSLPITIGVFGTIVYAISFVPAIQRIARLASPFFEETEATTAKLWPIGPFSIATGRLGVLLLVFLVVLNQVQVGISLRLSFFNRDFYNAIQEKDAASFWYQLI